MSSPEGKALAAKAVQILRDKGETADADYLEGLLTVCKATEKIWPEPKPFPPA